MTSATRSRSRTRQSLAASEWLARATKGGHPLAEITTAGDMLMNDRIAAYRTSFSSEHTQATSVDHREAARQLLLEALESKKPEVIWKVGDLQGLFDEDPRRATKKQFAWWLLACQRGFDCGESSDFYRLTCRADFRHLCQPGESGIDLIKRETQNDFFEIEQLARQISEKLDSGALDELIPAEF